MTSVKSFIAGMSLIPYFEWQHSEHANCKRKWLCLQTGDSHGRLRFATLCIFLYVARH